MKGSDARRAAIVIGLFVALFAVRFALESTDLHGATFLLVLPTVLAALWFGVRGGLAVAVAASVGFFLAEWGDRRRRSCGRCSGRRSCGSVPWC